MTKKSILLKIGGITAICAVALIISTLVPSTYASTQLADTPWPMFHHDLQHTGRSPYLGSQSNILKWSRIDVGIIDSSPAIGSDGTIYVASINSNKLFAINPIGSVKWSYNIRNYIYYSSPAIGSDGTIYVGSYNKLYTINPDGTLKWSYTTGGPINSSPAIGSDGTIYVGSYDYKLYALNPDGTLKWSYTTENYVYSSPAIGSDGTIYVGSSNKLYAINPDGTLKWSCTTGGYVNSSPAIGSDGTIYVVSRDNKFYAINPDGTLKWSYTLGGYGTRSSPSIGSDGTIYVGWSDKLYAINPDGTLKWSYTTGNSVESSPAIGSDGTIYVGSWDKNLYAINPDGTLKWSYTTGGWIGSSPAIGADGTIYVGAYDQKLYAFGVPPCQDLDGDGFKGTPAGCGPDCNDSNAAINPGASEVCNGIDDNCDGNIDEGVTTTFYGDADGDTYGDINNPTPACTLPTGYSATSDDCDDNNAAINPGASEVCDGIDNNCDGNIDDVDKDNDGVNDCTLDKCLGSVIPESVPTTGELRPNNYAQRDNDSWFEVNKGSASKPNIVDSQYSMNSTYGCTCEQILDCKPGEDVGELKWGCSEGIMKVWVGQTGWASKL